MKISSLTESGLKDARVSADVSYTAFIRDISYSGDQEIRSKVSRIIQESWQHWTTFFQTGIDQPHNRLIIKGIYISVSIVDYTHEKPKMAFYLRLHADALMNLGLSGTGP